MNLWLRLFWLLISALWRPAIALPRGVSVLPLRVWPHDLDLSLHMNNGRYLTLMDLGRIDMMLASGLWRAIARHRWTPIASAVKVRFRREMRLFQRFRLETRLLAWVGDQVVMEQVFVLASGPRAGQVAAHALFKGGLYDRTTRKFVPISRLMEESGVTAENPPLSPEVEAFLKADEELKRAGAERG
ncbi:MAG: thioesterase family protein [Hyphomicrobium sp.]